MILKKNLLSITVYDVPYCSLNWKLYSHLPYFSIENDAHYHPHKKLAIILGMFRNLAYVVLIVELVVLWKLRSETKNKTDRQKYSAQKKTTQVVSLTSTAMAPSVTPKSHSQLVSFSIWGVQQQRCFLMDPFIRSNALVIFIMRSVKILQMGAGVSPYNNWCKQRSDDWRW